MTDLWTACGHYLEQARSLVARLKPAQFASPHAHCYGGSIGGHVRHCLEHFDGFRRGLEAGAIDYDARRRGTPDESNPELAAQRLDDLIGWFGSEADRFGTGDRVRVKIDCGADSDDPSWEWSTVGRELQFLASHTVHHFAIIGIMCEAQSIPTDPDFGVAPSTLKSQRTEAAS